MLNLLSKPTCIFCDALSRRGIDLCADCESDLPVLKNHCKRCARLLPVGQDVCGSCLEKSSLILKTIVLFSYEPPIDRLITNLKFNNNLIGAKILGELLARHLVWQYKNKAKPEIIIPVPLHPCRLRERGYNQALELVKPAAKILDIPVDKYRVRRVKNTKAQTILSAKERQSNIKRAFWVSPEFQYQYVAVVDDVITTGSTVTELSKTLADGGVKQVDIWCLAKR